MCHFHAERLQRGASIPIVGGHIVNDPQPTGHMQQCVTAMLDGPTGSPGAATPPMPHNLQATHSRVSLLTQKAPLGVHGWPGAATPLIPPDLQAGHNSLSLPGHAVCSCPRSAGPLQLIASCARQVGFQGVTCQCHSRWNLLEQPFLQCRLQVPIAQGLQGLQEVAGRAAGAFGTISDHAILLPCPGWLSVHNYGRAQLQGFRVPLHKTWKPGHLAGGGQAPDLLHDPEWKVLRPDQPSEQA